MTNSQKQHHMYSSQKYTLIVKKLEISFNLKKKLVINNDHNIEIKLISDCCIIFNNSLILLTSSIVSSFNNN